MDEEAQAQDALVRYCAEFYDVVLGELLEEHRWSFAKKDRALTRTTAPIVDYQYAHQLPTDRVRLLRMIPGSENSEGDKVFFNGTLNRFRIVGNQVHSNAFHVALRYIYYNEDPTTWSKGFVACFARLLASYLAGPVADSLKIAEAHRAHYERIDKPNAIYLDAVQDESGENNDNETRLAGSGLVEAGRSEYFPTDQFDEPAGGAGTGVIIGDGSTIG